MSEKQTRIRITKDFSDRHDTATPEVRAAYPGLQVETCMHIPLDPHFGVRSGYAVLVTEMHRALEQMSPDLAAKYLANRKSAHDGLVGVIPDGTFENMFEMVFEDQCEVIA